MTSNDRSQTITRLGGQALYFLVGNVFTLLVGFPLQVYVARKLGAEGLGIFSLFEGAATLGANLLGFGLAQTLVKFIPDSLARHDYPAIRSLVWGGGKIMFLSGSLAVLAVWSLQWLQVPIPLLRSQPSVASLMVLMVPLSLFIYFFQQGLRGFQEVRYMVIGTSFLQLGVKAVSAVVLLQAGFALEGYVIAVVLSTFISALWLAQGLRRRMRELPSHTAVDTPRYRPEWRSFANVFYFDVWMGLAVTYLDRYLLGWLSGAASVGVLLLVKQLYALPAVFFNMFISIASPMFAGAHARNDAGERQHIYHLVLDWVFRLSIPFCLFLLVFADDVLSLYGSGFSEQGTVALRILVVGQIANIAMGPVGNMLTLSGFEKQLMKFTFVECCLSLLGTFWLIPLFGINGAAAVIAFVFVLQNTVLLAFARLKLGIRWFDRRFVKWGLPVLATSLIAAAVRTQVHALGAVLLIITVLGMYVAFAVASFLQGFSDDDKTMLDFLKARLQRSRP